MKTTPSLLLALALCAAPAAAGAGNAAPGVAAARAMSLMWEMMVWFMSNAATGGTGGPSSWASPWGGPWNQAGGWGGQWGNPGWPNQGTTTFGGFGGPWEAPRGGHSGGRIEGVWQSAAGEVLMIDKGRFALSPGANRGISGVIERRGDQLIAYIPEAGVSQTYRFFEGDGLLVLIDPQGRSISFRRVR